MKAKATKKTAPKAKAAKKAPAKKVETIKATAAPQMPAGTIPDMYMPNPKTIIMVLAKNIVAQVSASKFGMPLFSILPVKALKFKLKNKLSVVKLISVINDKKGAFKFDKKHMEAIKEAVPQIQYLSIVLHSGGATAQK